MNPLVGTSHSEKLTLRSKSGVAIFLLLLAVLVASSFFIIRDSGRVPVFPMDQYFVESVNLRIYKIYDKYWVFQYPPLQNAGGITSALIAGIYKLIVSTKPENLNWHIRILAMLMYITSSFVLIRAFVKDGWTRFLAFGIIATSGYQFIQPSSELFAGSLLNLFFLALWQSWPLWITSFFLAAFGLCKVELSLAALVIALFCALKMGRKANTTGWKIFPYTAAWMLFLLAPGFLVQGGSALAGNRSYLAFIATYAEIFQPHQFLNTSHFDSEQVVQNIRKNILGNSKSVFSIAISHPMIYIDFLALQTVRSVLGTVSGLKFMLFPFIGVIRRIDKIGNGRNMLIILLLASTLTLFPAWLLAYIRVRYWVKLFPAVIAIVACCCLALDNNRSRYKLLFWICGITTIILQLVFLPSIYQHSQFQ